MLLAFWIVVTLLLVAGALRTQFQKATLYWGRAITGVAYLERDIEQAKSAGDPVVAADLLGRSVQQRGLQDAITPPRQTSFTMLYWAACLGIYVSGFFVLPWYLAALWPIFFAAGKRVLGSMLPTPDTDFYRNKIIANLEARRDRFRRAGDEIRVDAADHMIMLLRTSDTNL